MKAMFSRFDNVPPKPPWESMPERIDSTELKSCILEAESMHMSGLRTLAIIVPNSAAISDVVR